MCHHVQCQLSVWITQQFVFTPAVLRSVWTTNSGELANHHCGVNTASLCERGYLWLIGLDLDWKLCRNSAFSHRETGLWISVAVSVSIMYRYSLSAYPWRDSLCFLKWGHIKYKSIVDLFPTVITDQRNLSLEKQRAAPAQTLSFVLQESREKAKFNHLKQGSPKKICNSSSVHCIEKIHIALHCRQTCLSCGNTCSQP